MNTFVYYESLVRYLGKSYTIDMKYFFNTGYPPSSYNNYQSTWNVVTIKDTP